MPVFLASSEYFLPGGACGMRSMQLAFTKSSSVCGTFPWLITWARTAAVRFGRSTCGFGGAGGGKFARDAGGAFLQAQSVKPRKAHKRSVLIIKLPTTDYLSHSALGSPRGKSQPALLFASVSTWPSTMPMLTRLLWRLTGRGVLGSPGTPAAVVPGERK